MRSKFNYSKYKELEGKYKRLVDGIASVRLVLFLVMVISFIGSYYYYPYILRGLCTISGISFVIVIFIHDRYFRIYDYYSKCIRVIDDYIKRESGEWKNFSDMGTDFLNDDSSVLEDLDIVGQSSLFQYLSICKTLGGRDNLLGKLSNKRITKNKLVSDQEAVKEITGNLDFVVDFQVELSKYQGKRVYLSKGLDDLSKGVRFSKRDFFIGCFCSLLVIILFIMGLFGILTYQYFYGMFLFNFMLSFMYSYIYRDEFRLLEDMVSSYGGLYSLFSVIVRRDFSSAKLKRIKREMENGIGYTEKLMGIDTINSLRNNFLGSFIFNGLFCINLVLMYLFSKLMDSSLDDFMVSVRDVEELEGMISVASLGIVRENVCMPEFSDEVRVDFVEIQHPLLDENICVSNDFSCSSGVNIITGSNMGGKTSFLRTIGINIILMGSGSYVCAKSFSASYFKLFTSMRVRDDITHGISTFYGELLRIEKAIKYVDKGNMLVLIDEIFKGTNYQDRIYGARQVINKLNTKNTILFITTHDFELCESNSVSNYHVKESYSGDKITFDYKIRKGRCTSTNARYLMKRLGIID